MIVSYPFLLLLSLISCLLYPYPLHTHTYTYNNPHSHFAFWAEGLMVVIYSWLNFDPNIFISIINVII